MRKILLAITLLAVGHLFASRSYSLPDALQKNLVKVYITGAAHDSTFYSSHFGPCLSMQITSIAGETLNLNLDDGYMLQPVDPRYQAMMVTRALALKLQPKQKTGCRIYAMCTQATNAGPRPEMRFNLHNRSTGSMLDLAKLIDKKDYQCSEAQDALWCLTDDHDLYEIRNSDTTMMYELRRFVARAKGMPDSVIYLAWGRSSSAKMHSGVLTYTLTRPHQVLIALYDEDNHRKKTFINNKIMDRGTYSCNYLINDEEMYHKKCYVRFFSDGKLTDEILITPIE